MSMLGLGDNVVDCYLDEQIYYPGGNAVNVAVGCKRNGFDRVEYLGVFGCDEKARHIQWALAQEGISYDYSRYVLAGSGSPGVRLDENGDRKFVGGPRDTAQHILSICLTQKDLEYISTFDLCHTSCYSNINHELPKLLGRCDVSYDFSDRRSPELLKLVCPYIRFAFFSGSGLSEEQLHSLIASVSDYGVEVVGITLGESGAAFSIKGKMYYQGIHTAQIVDTMGAGDSFISAFLTAYYQLKSPEVCLELAAKSAAITCGYHGGFGYGKPFGETC
ncbi:MAG TPA: carbohydrate kinase [Clostridiales bacterium]|nr:carbohydrate kinase [Clostridiales bacterium]